jgi:radical SAM protein with 4Fe4S-binding SPASM domain
MNNAFRLLKCLSFRRVLNLLKIYISFYLTRIRKKPIQWGLPFSISIEPTTACNLRCPECPSGLRSFSRDTGNLKMDLLQKIIDEIHKEVFYLTFYFQGEPYINPHFLEMVAYAKSKRIYTSTSTNGHFLNDQNAEATVRSGLDRLIVSIDGTTQETYEAYRKAGNLANVLKGVENLVAWKKKLKSASPHIVVQFLVVRPNEHQIPDIQALAKKIGANEVVLKTAQIYDYEQGNPLIPTLDKYSRYARQADGTYKIKNQLLNHCWKLWHACVFTWDGLVVPCCFDKDAKYQLGDVKNTAFREIWQGKAYQNFRKMLLRGRANIDICKNCTEGCKVWVEE